MVAADRTMLKRLLKIIRYKVEKENRKIESANFVHNPFYAARTYVWSENLKTPRD